MAHGVWLGVTPCSSCCADCASPCSWILLVVFVHGCLAFPRGLRFVRYMSRLVPMAMRCNSRSGRGLRSVKPCGPCLFFYPANCLVVSQSSLFSALLLLGGFHGPAHDQALCLGFNQGVHDLCLQGFAFAWIAWVFRVPTALPSMLMHRADDAASSLGCCNIPQQMQQPQVDGLAPAAPRPLDFPTLLQNVRNCTSLRIVLQS